MAYRIVIKGLAGPSNTDDRSTLDGIECDDDFAEYFHKEYTIGDRYYQNQQCLIDKGVKNGYMRFSFEKEKLSGFKEIDPYDEDNWNDLGKLYVIVEYESREKLTDEELEILKKYTKGQMSDGIGESFEQNPVKYDHGLEIYLSPWFMGQKLTVTQTEI